MPINRPSTAPPKPKTPAYAASAINSTAGADETDLLPGDRARAVRVKPPPIQGNDATTTYTGAPQGKDGRPIPPPEDYTPKLIKPPTIPTPPPTGFPPAPPAATGPSNNVVIRQWNLNRGIPNQKMQWDPATQALMMDGRPVFQVGRNMSIDAQGNGVTDEPTWRREMERYGYGEQANSNVPDYQRGLLNGADTTRDPKVYWASALGQAENQRILKDRDAAMIAARQAAQARGASINSSTFARLQGNVIGTEEQARIDAAPKLMDAARRSYLDILNSDIAARAGQNAQEIAESNVNGMFRGAPTYGAQKDAISGVMDIAKERETMPGMDTSMLTHPGMKALGGQINDIAGQERWLVTDPRENRGVTRENNFMDDARAKAESKSKDWTASQQKMWQDVHAWMNENNVPLNKAGYDRALKEFGAAGGMTGKQAQEVLELMFGGSKSTESEKSLAERRATVVTNMTSSILSLKQQLGKPTGTPEQRAAVFTEIAKKLEAEYAADASAFEPLTLPEAKELAQKILEISNNFPTAKALLEQLGVHAPPD